jgi:hypothetical protein
MTCGSASLAGGRIRGARGARHGYPKARTCLLRQHKNNAGPGHWMRGNEAERREDSRSNSMRLRNSFFYFNNSMSKEFIKFDASKEFTRQIALRNPG